MTKQSNWFEVDKEGLAQLVADRGPGQLLVELISNAWDEKSTTRVDVGITATPGVPYVEVQITDDAPNGFADLSQAFTLFAPSYKKAEADKRGRFNLGEKLVLSMCQWAQITSTTGTVTFDANGRSNGRTKREAGTEFRARMRMTRNELRTTHALLQRLIGLRNVETRVQIIYGPGDIKFFRIEDRNEMAGVEHTLSTVLAGEDGYLRRTQRKTRVLVYQADGEGWLFELGIPVVEIGGPYDVNVLQKVPLNTDRDNVPVSYRRQIRTLVLDAMHKRLTKEQAADEWVTDALPQATDTAIAKVLDKRFGEKRVSYDPSDREANSLAVSKGYTVVPGGALSGDTWARVKEAGAIKPAGQVTPSPRQEFSANGVDVEVPREQWPAGAARLVELYQSAAIACLGVDIEVKLASKLPPHNPAACYGNRTMILNLRRLGRAWFQVVADTGGLGVQHLDLLIHELGHEHSEDHLSEAYHSALTYIGARLVVWAALDASRVFTATEHK